MDRKAELILAAAAFFMISIFIIILITGIPNQEVEWSPPFEAFDIDGHEYIRVINTETGIEKEAHSAYCKCHENK